MSIQNQPEFSLVFPMYNEEACAESVIHEMLEEFDKSNINYELVPVNNGSVDSTGKILDQLATKYQRIKPVHLSPPNEGYGNGIIAGLKATKGKIIGFTCGDGEVSAEDALKVYNKIINNNLDLCKAIRVVRTYNAYRKFISKGYNFFIKSLFNFKVNDINGFPVIWHKHKLDPNKLSVKNWMINLEIQQFAKKLKLKIGEEEVKYGQRKGGRSHVRFFTMFDFIKQLLLYRFKSLFQKI